MIPSQVQHSPSGQWQRWTSGHTDSDLLRLKVRTGNGQPTYVNGVLVYALKFENGQEWNIKEGWK